MQDSRRVADVAGIPVLEPSLADDANTVLVHATRVSEQVGVPVLIRITTAAHRRCEPGEPPVELPPARLVPSLRVMQRHEVAHGLTKLGRHQRHWIVFESLDTSLVTHADLVDVRCAEECGPAVIADRRAAQRVREVVRQLPTKRWDDLL